MTNTPQRNEAHFCPGCDQCNTLHPSSKPPGVDCTYSHNDYGLDTEHYRDDEPGHNDLGEVGYGEDYK